MEFELSASKFATITESGNFCAVGPVRNYTVSLCNRAEISDFIEKWHYSKNVNGLTINYCFKLQDGAGNLIGAMIYGKIAMANVWKKYAQKESELIELKRLCCIIIHQRILKVFLLEIH